MLLRTARIAGVQVPDVLPGRGHWPDIARQWRHVGPPLRPSPEDVEFYAATIRCWACANGSPRALILGVTPELYALAWPEGTDLVAVDHTPAMIDAVWPGPRDAVYCAEWIALPLADGSRDVALCDGGLQLLPPYDHQRFVRSLQRVLKPGGLFLVRLFVPIRPRETSETVLSHLLAGKIANPNILKLRLGMALQDTSARGVALGHIWDALARVAPDLSELAERLGWPPDPLLAIDSYRGSPTRYHFLGIEQAEHLFCARPGGFTLESIHLPAYALGTRCPTLVLRRQGK